MNWRFSERITVQILKGVIKLMAELQDLQKNVADLKVAVDRIVAVVGTPPAASAADLTALSGSVTALTSEIDKASPPAPTPVPVP